MEIRRKKGKWFDETGRELQPDEVKEIFERISQELDSDLADTGFEGVIKGVAKKVIKFAPKIVDKKIADSDEWDESEDVREELADKLEEIKDIEQEIEDLQKELEQLTKEKANLEEEYRQLKDELPIAGQ
ncbi:hypothetical protein AB1I63_07325 [Streptococcus pneumoniae]